jgi:hypothetical protein
MAGETWKSHQMTTRERDLAMDHAQQLADVDAAAAIHDEWMFGPDDTAVVIKPGTRFTHPTQGVCTVTRVTPKSIRYTAQARPGFSPVPHTTTRTALDACLDAGILRLLPEGA